MPVRSTNLRVIRSCHIAMSLILIAVTLAAGSKESTLQDLMDRETSARPEDRAKLCVEIVSRELKEADKFYAEGKVEDANNAVHELVLFADKAKDAALQAPSKLKGTEIAMRKTAAKLRDIKHTLNAADQPLVETAAEHIENLRTEMLAHMFAKD